ncbi:MAG: 50S ribosomal protein L9 [Anaerolineales bacterium]|nr:50S ribosomal protein L9 [Anaerolineales bacterium]
MKVLLLKDVYKLGRAGDVKKVADGYGRNFLLPQGLAVLATAGALKQVETIRTSAAATRNQLNEELSGVAEQLEKLVLTFAVKAGETGKLYGSITQQMIASAIMEKSGFEADRRQLDMQPIRVLGEHKVRVRLTLDLIPTVNVIVHREGEAPEIAEEVQPEAEPEVEAVPPVETEGEETIPGDAEPEAASEPS